MMKKKMQTFEAKTKISDGTLEAGSKALSEPAFLHPVVTIPRAKVKACWYFLDLFKMNILNEAATRCHIEAIAKFLRSATFTLQYICDKAPGFHEWYEAAQEQMKEDPLLKEMVMLRNVAEKRGLDLIEFGLKIQRNHFRNEKVETKYLPVEIKINGVHLKDPVADLKKAIESISRVVEDAHEKGFVKIPESKDMLLRVEFRREKPDGSWEFFDPK
ncbi:MAG: hypothetical protein CVV64_18445 [Candidatus Wallbacteria bacterium HGW-Wallbacteria-1]|jgi:hypothetical protein|uniref:Uncharacterized protein n=1 Tax=Candidatus Wallbacteria bacterium HGW-Wallbacteria-1 TaxID=2013854 RepID=A0A2N1PJL9_9BACT|nr:MAG: hypothetical protein CVV64_18445 [Candidatus Wallbacteria bacterium HGW-Wallbacteria-1]